MVIGNQRFRQGLRRAAQHFGIGGPGPGLSEQVVLTVDMLLLSGITAIERFSVVVDDDGEFIIATCPPGEIWVMQHLTYGIETGTFILDNLFVNDDSTQSNLLITKTDVTVEEAFLSTAETIRFKGMRFYPGMQLGTTIKTESVPGTVVAVIMKTVIDYDPDSRA